MSFSECSATVERYSRSGDIAARWPRLGPIGPAIEYHWCLRTRRCAHHNPMPKRPPVMWIAGDDVPMSAIRRRARRLRRNETGFRAMRLNAWIMTYRSGVIAAHSPRRADSHPTTL
jgi:hypothetical protein